LRRQLAVGPSGNRPNSDFLMSRPIRAHAPADDVSTEIKLAVQRIRSRNLRCPVDPPRRQRIALPCGIDEPGAKEGEAAGMIVRRGLQFHWSNPGYRDFADFLSTFNHDKRKKVKQERRKLAEAGVSFVRKCGADITPADWRFFYGCYERTYRAHHSTPYLTLDFFRRVGRTLPGNVMMVIGLRDGAPLCAALDVYDDDALWGRYWGTTDFVRGLHFEACYYQAIEFCIERRIARFEGGAQGVHKLARGLLPVPTQSLQLRSTCGRPSGSARDILLNIASRPFSSPIVSVSVSYAKHKSPPLVASCLAFFAAR